MLIFHKFVDVLRGASHELPLRIFDGVLPKHIKAVCECIIDAEKFDFGTLHLEPADLPQQFSTPQITDDEYEAWVQGLVPLPAPICWFEFTMGGCRSGLLTIEVDREWRVMRLDWTNRPGDFLLYDGHLVSISKDDPRYRIRISGPPGVNDMDRKQAGMVYGTSAILALYLALMIMSPSTESRTERAPEKLNRARAARGRTPLADHRVVRIVPERYLRERRAEAGLTRLPPRLHWRRSHIRTLHRDEPNQRRILIPRCLVGGASDAEVSHEYRLG